LANRLNAPITKLPEPVVFKTVEGDFRCDEEAVFVFRAQTTNDLWQTCRVKACLSDANMPLLLKTYDADILHIEKGGDSFLQTKWDQLQGRESRQLVKVGDCLRL